MNNRKHVSNMMRWIQQMWGTQDEEISCSDCLELVSEYVTLELATAEAEQRMPHLKQHLDQCKACQEEYLVLRDLARMEEEGEPPSIEDLRDSL